LKGYHIPAAFIKPQNKSSLLFLQHHKFPFYVKIANVIDRRTARIFLKKEGSALSFPLFELHYGSGKDSMITESHLQVFELCSYDEVRLIYRICSKVNVVLKSFFSRRNYLLAELNCHFGKTEDKIYLIDGFTPNSLKILPAEVGSKTLNPYKLTTSGEMRHYTDQIFNLINT
jgi:phosphoribosylaminoimidazole-succinocarboxamide synthase